MADIPLYKRVAQLEAPRSANTGAQKALSAFTNTAYQSSLSILAKNLEAQDQNILAEERKVFQAEAKTAIYNALANGQPEYAEEMRAQAYDYLRHGGANLNISNAKREYEANEIVKFYEASKVETHFNNLMVKSPQKAEAFLQERLKLPQTVENIEIDNSLMTQYNHYKALQKEQFTLGEALQNSDNSGYFATKSPKELDTILDAYTKQLSQETGEPVSLPLMAQAALKFNTTFPGLNKIISADIVNGSPQQSIQAMRIYSGGGDGPVFASVDSDAKAKASMFDTLSRSGNTDEQAYIRMQQATQLTPELAKQRAEGWQQSTKENQAYSAANTKKSAAKALGIIGFFGGGNPDGLADGVAALFRANVEVAYKQVGDLETAEKMAAADFKRTWGQTEVNGYPQYMYAAPSKFVPKGVDVDKRVRNDVTEQFRNNADKIKELYDNPKVQWPYYFEVGKDGTVTQVFRNGGKVKGKLNIQPDQMTFYSQNPNDGPSYSVGIDVDGNFMNIPSVDNNMDVMRYRLDSYGITKEAQENAEKDRKRAIEATIQSHKLGTENQKRLKALGFPNE